MIVGDDLLKQNYPMVHAVGRASARAPRLIDLTWGRESDPKVTLVGKGVCFDTGGLDLKPSSGMLQHEEGHGRRRARDGAGAMMMAAKLPVRLRVLVPAVENSVSGNAFRPLDVLPTRKGITVEIGNTDAEGRLILCDALAEGASEKPDLMVDCATLTGAARVALGTELPALFCNDDALAADLIAAGKDAHDPMWRLPLYAGYRRLLDSKVADINNAPGVAFAGAITAALYLKEFVPDDVPWAHFDMMAWNNASRPGRPEGGEAQAARAIFAPIEKRIGKYKCAPQLIPRLRIDAIDQLASVAQPPDVLDHAGRGGARVGGAGDVRRHMHLGMRPVGMLGRQRLLVEHVEHRAAQVARIERRQQRLVHDVAAARHVDEIGALGQRREGLGVQKPARVARERQHVDQDVALGQDFR